MVDRINEIKATITKDNKQVKTKELRSALFDKNWVKNVFLTIVTFGRRLDRLDAEAREIYQTTLEANELALFPELEAAIKELDGKPLPSGIDTPQKAIDHIAAILYQDSRFRDNYTEEFLKTVVKASLVGKRTLKQDGDQWSAILAKISEQNKKAPKKFEYTPEQIALLKRGTLTLGDMSSSEMLDIYQSHLPIVIKRTAMQQALRDADVAKTLQAERSNTTWHRLKIEDVDHLDPYAPANQLSAPIDINTAYSVEKESLVVSSKFLTDLSRILTPLIFKIGVDQPPTIIPAEIDLKERHKLVLGFLQTLDPSLSETLQIILSQAFPTIFKDAITNRFETIKSLEGTFLQFDPHSYTFTLSADKVQLEFTVPGTIVRTSFHSADGLIKEESFALTVKLDLTRGDDGKWQNAQITDSSVSIQ